MVTIGGYDSDGIIQMSCSGTTRAEAARSLADAGFDLSRQVELPDGAISAATHKVDCVTHDVIPYTPEPRVPPSITRTQLLLGMKRYGFITGAEAVAAAVAGTIPAAVEAVFAALPQDDQDEARIIWGAMGAVHRDHPLVPMLAATQGMSCTDIDNFFIACAQL